jgi:hypothetical protein
MARSDPGLSRRIMRGGPRARTDWSRRGRGRLDSRPVTSGAASIRIAGRRGRAALIRRERTIGHPGASTVRRRPVARVVARHPDGTPPMYKLLFAGMTVPGLITLTAVRARPTAQAVPVAGEETPRAAEICSLRAEAVAVRRLLGQHRPRREQRRPPDGRRVHRRQSRADQCPGARHRAGQAN